MTVKIKVLIHSATQLHESPLEKAT